MDPTSRISLLGERWRASYALPCYRAAVGLVPELIFVDGALETPGGGDSPRPQALAVTNGRIAAIGSTQHVRGVAGPSTRAMELGGRSLLPGFIDAHVHPLEG